MSEFLWPPISLQVPSLWLTIKDLLQDDALTTLLQFTVNQKKQALPSASTRSLAGNSIAYL